MPVNGAILLLKRSLNAAKRNRGSCSLKPLIPLHSINATLIGIIFSSRLFLWNYLLEIAGR